MPSSGCKKRALDRKSTRLNSSHTIISYAVFCLKKKHIPELTHPPTQARAPATPTPPPPAGRRGCRWARARTPAQQCVGSPNTSPFFFFNYTRPPEFPPFPPPRPFPV